MALNFFKQRDIDEIDVNDIPEEFINYLETLDEAGKIGLLASRPDIAKVLGVSVEDSNQDTVNTTDDSSEIVQEDERNPKSSAVFEEEQDIRNSVDVEPDVDEPEEVNEEFIAIQNNYYEGKRLAEILKDNMEPLEALAIPDKTDKCFIHRVLFKEKQIRYTGKGATYGVVLKICPQCNRIYLEESGKEYIHEALTKRNIAHTFYSLETSNQYLRSQIKAYEIADQDKIYIPEIWTEDNPLCPVHEEALFEIPCIKKYKDRKVEFTGYFCDKCNKILMRSSSVAELEDNCALNGVPVIETESFVKKRPKKQLIKMREIKPDYIVENGKREIYTYSHAADCFKLTEEDTVVVSDSIYCSLEGHKTEEVLVLIWVNQKKGGRKSYIFVVGYCSQCQKYYMDIDDYNVIYSLGRPEVTIISDVNDADYQITSGEVFNLERNHLNNIESGITGEIKEIHESTDYVNPYAVGDYDDGNLSFAKSLSANKYGKRLEELENYIPKPYSYRVDISADGATETYYIGASDVILKDGKKVISANSDLGYELINYQTIKIHKDGKEYGIKLSRQFDIDQASLYGYVNLRTDEDVIFQSGITDPFLVRVLNIRKKQHNLTDIFVTIQENQNKIVNTDFNKNIIVQGCAGSGKTMVLLHRLSALKYRQRYFDFSQNALILTPNEQFSLHIKGLAEGLQIGSVHRISVEQYYLDMLLQYDSAFKPENKIVSEMQVRQDYDLYVQLMFAMKYFNKKIGNMQFICVDEGQDLAVNEYRLLSELNQNHVVFNIFGDTNQLMKSGRGISDWNLLLSELQAEQYVLNENYRNTNQITRFCNDNFGLKTLQTGVDGPKVREISRRDLEKELAGLMITTERIAILLPRTVQKMKYLDMDILPENIRNMIGETMDNGFISVMYVDEVKGIEFDKVFVVSAAMHRNEKYIAYTRALSELIVVVDEKLMNNNSAKKVKENIEHNKKAGIHSAKMTGTLKWEKTKQPKAYTLEKTIDNDVITYHFTENTKSIIKNEFANTDSILPSSIASSPLTNIKKNIYAHYVYIENSICYNINCKENMGKKCNKEGNCDYYISLPVPPDEEELIAEDIDNAKKYLAKYS